jgi:hypothetical protein
MSCQILSSFDWLILLSSSWGLFILICLIQIVHYPSFRYIDATQFSDFHQHHTSTITLIVLPLMLCELSNVLWVTYKSGFSSIFLLLSGIVILIWVTTFLVSVPLHAQMAQFKNAEAIEKLISTNWVRIILWTAKVVIVTFLFYKNVKIC